MVNKIREPTTPSGSPDNSGDESGPNLPPRRQFRGWRAIEAARKFKSGIEQADTADGSDVAPAAGDDTSAEAGDDSNVTPANENKDGDDPAPGAGDETAPGADTDDTGDGGADTGGGRRKTKSARRTLRKKLIPGGVL